MANNYIKIVLKLIVFITILFGTILLFFGPHIPKQKQNDIETMDTMSKETLAKSFCTNYRGRSGVLNTECEKLTETNCGLTSCCVWASPGKCVAGNERGPTFNTDEQGKTKPLDYYYYKNKCYGAKCGSSFTKKLI